MQKLSWIKMTFNYWTEFVSISCHNIFIAHHPLCAQFGSLIRLLNSAIACHGFSNFFPLIFSTCCRMKSAVHHKWIMSRFNFVQHFYSIFIVQFFSSPIWYFASCLHMIITNLIVSMVFFHCILCNLHQIDSFTQY